MYSSATCLKSAFSFIPARMAEQKIMIELADENYNSFKMVNLNSILSGAREFTIKNLTTKIISDYQEKQCTVKTGNFNTGCKTTNYKASKYGYDAIEN
jgi:hypothetical protein